MRSSRKKPLAGGYGTQISKKPYQPNTVFKKMNIPLEMHYHSIDDFEDIKMFTAFIHRVVKENRDVLVCFNYKSLYGMGNNGGHVSIVDRVYPKKRELRLVDPTRFQPRWRTVKIKKLKKAMEVHAKDSSPGFWEFVRIK